jgi:membrane protease YdiL (CAAX protease family)
VITLYNKSNQNTNNSKPLKGMGFIQSFSIFSTAAILMFLGTQFLIPYLSEITGYKTILIWFLVAGLGVFTPLIIIALWILKSEGSLSRQNLIRGRLRFRRMNKTDVMWSLGAILAIGVLSSGIMWLIEIFYGSVESQAPFMKIEPLAAEQYWIIALWFPYWLLNIVGEEFLWRGVMLPRQEITFGKLTWIYHSFGWALFHIIFGWQLLLMMIPVLFILPKVVQHRGNTWIGVIIHGGINGPAFLAIAFGLL